MSDDRFIPFVRRAAGVVSKVGIAVVLAAATVSALMAGVVCLDTRLVSVPEILERSGGCWELDEVVGLDASYAERFGRVLELRWDEVELDAHVGDDGTRAIALGRLVRDGVEQPVEMRWRRAGASSLAPGLDSRGGEPIEGWPRLSLMMDVGECVGFEELWVLPHGNRLPQLGTASLRYTRVD